MRSACDAGSRRSGTKAPKVPPRVPLTDRRPGSLPNRAVPGRHAIPPPAPRRLAGRRAPLAGARPARRHGGAGRTRRSPAPASTRARSGPATCTPRCRAPARTGPGSPATAAGAGRRRGAHRPRRARRSRRAPGCRCSSWPTPAGVLGAVAAWVYGEPADELLMLGVTGTNGKTTTTYLLDAALRAAAAATRAWSAPSRPGSATERCPACAPRRRRTDLQALLAVMLERGVTTCSMEVSSHALALHRVDGIVFDVAGFTNLSQDHLDFHPTRWTVLRGQGRAVHARALAPRRGLRRRRVGPAARDGRRGAGDHGRHPRLRRRARRTGRSPTAASRAPARRSRSPARTAPRSPAAARCPASSTSPTPSLAARHAASRTAWRRGTAAAWLADAGAVPGRMEPVTGAGAPGEPLAVVDYAHTPDAVTAAVRSLRAGRPAARARSSSSSAPAATATARSGRDGRRGRAGADVVVVTDDNPRTEDPAAIRAAVLAGARSVRGGHRRRGRRGRRPRGRDRRGASAGRGRGDALLVAGKGHETGPGGRRRRAPVRRPRGAGRARCSPSRRWPGDPADARRGRRRRRRPPRGRRRPRTRP